MCRNSYKYNKKSVLSINYFLGFPVGFLSKYQLSLFMITLWEPSSQPAVVTPQTMVKRSVEKLGPLFDIIIIVNAIILYIIKLLQSKWKCSEGYVFPVLFKLSKDSSHKHWEEQSMLRKTYH